jgi:CSLREA domain-containing protein
MRLTNWLAGLARKQPRSRQSTRRGRYGDLASAAELLEGRTLLRVFTVNTTADTVDADPGDGMAADSNGATSLRAAIMEANSLAGDDTITIPAGIYTRTLGGLNEGHATTGDLDVRDNLTINGVGGAETIIDAAGLDRVILSFPLVQREGVRSQDSSLTDRALFRDRAFELSFESLVVGREFDGSFQVTDRFASPVRFEQ